MSEGGQGPPALPSTNWRTGGEAPEGLGRAGPPQVRTRAGQLAGQRRLPRWRRPAEAAPSAGAAAGRRLRILGTRALILSLMIAAVAVVAAWLRPPAPAALILIGSDYADNPTMSTFVNGRRGLEAIAKAAGTGPRIARSVGRLRLVSNGVLNPRTLGGGGPLWDADLKQIPAEPNVVIAVALHGGVDAQGAYLLTSDANLPGAVSGDPGRIRLNDLLSRCEALGHAGKRVLLLIEGSASEADPARGMLRNGFASRLEAESERILKTPGLVVIAASEPGQVAHPAPLWGTTVFTQAIAQGLAGGAADRVGTVTAQGLFIHAKQVVSRVVREQGHSPQVPMLLPAGPEGFRRAARIELTTVSPRAAATAREVELPRTSPVSVNDALVSAAWTRLAELARRDPPPAAYQPRRWAEALTCLTNLADLCRSGIGDEPAARAWAETLKDHLEALADNRLPLPLDLLSTGTTTALTALEGQGAWPPGINPEDIDATAAKLWTGPDDAAARAWDGLQAAAPGRAATTLLRARLTDRLLDRALVVADPAAGLTRLSALIRKLDTPATPRAVELHDALLLSLNLPTGEPGITRTPGALIVRSLRLTRRAERAALGVAPQGPESLGRDPRSAEARPWLAADLALADRARRLGRDLLISTRPSDWEAAEASFARAEKALDRAETAAVAARLAFSVRDRVLPALPGLTAWLVRRDDDTDAVLDAATDRLETLWDDTHALAEALAQGPDGSTVSDASALGTLAEAVASKYEMARNDYEAFVRKVEAAPGKRALAWSDAALAAPVLESEWRGRLEARYRSALAEAREQTAPGPVSADKTETEDPIRDSASIGSGTARSTARQARLELASLGRRAYGLLASGPHDGADASLAASAWAAIGAPNKARQPTLPFMALRQRIAAFGRSLDSDDSWRSAAENAAETLAAARVASALEIRRLTRFGRWADADPLVRATDGVALDALDLPDVAEPVRRELARGLLEAQMARVWDDHWWSERQGVEPYMLRVGRALLTDAQRLDDRRADDPGRAALDTWASRFKDPKPLAWDGPARAAVTTDARIDLSYGLKLAGGTPIPDGYVLTWTRVTGPLRPDRPRPGERIVQAAGEAPTDPAALKQGPAGSVPGSTESIESESKRLRWFGGVNLPEFGDPTLWTKGIAPYPRPTPAGVVVEGLFRGQRFRIETVLDLHAVPDAVMAEVPKPPARLGVAVAPELLTELGTTDGALAIVLDCSGSMGLPRPQTNANEPPANGPSKYEEAIDALAMILPQIRKGTTVSLWIFGQATGPDKTNDLPETAIRRVLAPTIWDPADPDRLARLLADLRRFEPWNESPVIRTLLKAREDLWDIAGPKTLLLLTDGVDNRWEQDKIANPSGKLGSDALREAFGVKAGADNRTSTARRDPRPGIQVLIVGYRADQRFRDAFNVVDAFDPPGRLYVVDQKLDLTQTIVKALKPRFKFWVKPPQLPWPSDWPQRGIEVGSGEVDQWFPDPLPPGAYQVRLQADRDRQVSALLAAGDLLRLRLLKKADAEAGPAGDPGRAVFERRLLSTEEFSFKPRSQVIDKDNRRWFLSVLEGRLKPDDSAEFTTTLEKAFEPDNEPVLQLPRPGTTWMELGPQPEQGPTVPPTWSVRWREVSGYPAAAIGLEVPRWPRVASSSLPAVPVLTAWFDPDNMTPPVAVMGSDQLKSPVELATPRGLIRVDAPTVETRLVEIAEGQRRPTPCLVIRARYGRGTGVGGAASSSTSASTPLKPVDLAVWSRPIGLAYAGSEHRFYHEAGVYTGLFWPVASLEEVYQAVRRIEFVSVAEFKARAERDGQAMRNDKLRPPGARTLGTSPWSAPGP